MVKHINIKIYGDVQGVGFRYEAKIIADKLGVKGFARNGADSSVYIEAEGGDLEKFLEWCRKGPDLARVDRVDFKFGDKISGFEIFDVK